VPEHTELTWLLCALAELGRLQRMHQFRDKAPAQLVSAGTLLYPVHAGRGCAHFAYRAEEVPARTSAHLGWQRHRAAVQRSSATGGKC
jgi:tryptophanyl-tRNA synthetase